MLWWLVALALSPIGTAENCEHRDQCEEDAQDWDGMWMLKLGVCPMFVSMVDPMPYTPSTISPEMAGFNLPRPSCQFTWVLLFERTPQYLSHLELGWTNPLEWTTKVRYIINKRTIFRFVKLPEGTLWQSNSRLDTHRIPDIPQPNVDRAISGVGRLVYYKMNIVRGLNWVDMQVELYIYTYVCVLYCVIYIYTLYI
jgi:hypothetical protein